MAVIEESPVDFSPPESEREQASLRPRRRRAAGRRDLTWNVLTVLVWISMACMVMAFISIYANPKSILNPFRPVQQPTLAAMVILPTMTASPMPAATLQGDPPQPTETPAPPTATPTPTQTPENTSTPGPSPTATIHSLYPFILRGEIKVIDAATFPDHDGCKLWVAGQAYDLQGAPMVGITVMLGGTLDYKNLYQLSLTGTALQYGQAGYEFTALDHMVKSKQAAWVELFDQAMLPLSGKVYFDTTDDCKQNLILINFKQVR